MSSEIGAAVVLQGDCREIVPNLGQFSFIFADPPFNIDQAYVGYDDSDPEFERLLWEAVPRCWTACNGVMALHGPDALVEIYLQIQRSLGMRRIAWVNWHYRFGQCTRSNWIDARCHCLIYAKHNTYTWNPEDVLVESDRVTYGDKRVNETDRGGMRLPGTVFGVPSDGPYWGRVQGTSIERRASSPNQLPERYLERLIRAYTNPGDLVLDPFAGSGTTAAVAAALGRHCVTIDVSEATCAEVRDRVAGGAVRIGATDA